MAGLSVYFVASIAIRDREEYEKYLAGADSVFERYGGEYLAVDMNPEVVEGEWSCERLVLIRFPSEDEFRRWYYSSEYQELLQHRLAGACCNTLLVKGKAVASLPVAPPPASPEQE
jgi:uncharacterized protein (DUF1330 family)